MTASNVVGPLIRLAIVVGLLAVPAAASAQVFPDKEARAQVIDHVIDGSTALIRLDVDETRYRIEPADEDSVTRLYPTQPPEQAQIAKAERRTDARHPCGGAASVDRAGSVDESAAKPHCKRKKQCRVSKRKLLIGAIVMWYAIGLLVAAFIIMRRRPDDD